MSAKFTKLIGLDFAGGAIDNRLSEKPLELFSKTIIETIQDFQQEDKAFSNVTEENLSRVKNLRKLKQSSLVRLLKLLKSIGLSYRVRVDGEANPYLLCSQPVILYPRDDSDGGTDYYYRVMARIEIVRSTSSTPSSHLTPDQVARLKGFCENLILVGLQMRLNSVLMSASLDEISQFFMNVTLNDVDDTFDLIPYEDYVFLLDVCDSVLDALSSAAVVAKAQKIALNVDRPFWLKLRALVLHLPRFGSLRLGNLRIITQNTMNQLSSDIRSLQISNVVGAESVVETLQQRLISVNTLRSKQKDCVVDAGSMLRITDSVNNIVRLVMCDIQCLTDMARKDLNQLEFDEDYEFFINHFDLVQKRQAQIKFALHCNDLVDLCRTVETELERLVLVGVPASALAPSLASLATAIQAFQGLVARYARSFRLFSRSTWKLAYILCNLSISLFRNGYCKSEAIEDEGNDSDMDQDGELDGTGIGEGEGTKDVSNEIEDEEQVLGLKDQEEEEQESTSKEEESGLEMEADFEGQLEDVKIDGQIDDDESGDDENEMEERMGDDLQNQGEVVDEKLWGDDEQDPPSKEETVEDGSPVDAHKNETELVAKSDEVEEKEETDDTKTKDKEEANDNGNQPETALDTEESNSINDETVLEEDHGFQPRPDEDIENPDASEDIPEDIKLDDGDEDEDMAFDDQESGEFEDDKSVKSCSPETEDETALSPAEDGKDDSNARDPGTEEKDDQDGNEFENLQSLLESPGENGCRDISEQRSADQGYQTSIDVANDENVESNGMSVVYLLSPIKYTH